MPYRNAVLFIWIVQSVATRELNIYERNWVVSKNYINIDDDYRACIREGKKEDGSVM